MKKILIVIILYSLSSCAGYERMFLLKGKAFQINEINYINNSDLNKDFAKYLKPYQKDLIGNKIDLEIGINYQENIISRDSKGDPSMYEIVINAKLVVYHNQTKTDLSFREKTDYSHQVSQFELNAYKKELRENLIKKIINKIILELQNL